MIIITKEECLSKYVILKNCHAVHITYEFYRLGIFTSPHLADYLNKEDTTNEARLIVKHVWNNYNNKYYE